jgi:threonyl-tRNA synthetase
MNQELLRHSAAHLLAQAINRLYPETLFGIGPATKDGFFYDVVKKEGTFKQDDLLKITEEMKKIVAEDLPISHSLISKDQGRIIFKYNPFKMDIIENQIQDNVVGLAVQGEFIDLCKGGHVASTGLLGNFVLTGISGSYWRACREGTPMQRISGVIFETADQLEAYLQKAKDLERYDHRVLGKEMELFGLLDEGPGFPFFYPKGTAIINAMMSYMRQLTKLHGYQEIKTPTLLNQNLWKKSGHYAHYKENMYSVSCDNAEYAIKPMNCPGAFLTYLSRPRSYRELPLRLSEFGHVHRHELSGVLHGLTRVRAFTQDDAHIMCRHKDITGEVSLVFSLIQKVMESAELKISKVVLSTRPQKAAGSIEIWDKAIESLKQALEKHDQKYEIAEGDGAFYGPKIGIEMQDSFGRVWSCGTIQLDFIQPENFDLCCVNELGERERIVVIHQAMFGSLERFLAICLEHHKGKLPFWMCPVQLRVIAMTVDQREYAKKVTEFFVKNDFRVVFDEEDNDPLRAKLQKSILNYEYGSIILGKKEQLSSTLSIRYNYTNVQKNGISWQDCIDEMKSYSPFH